MQLTALLFMLMFVLGVTVFERADTVASFLESDDAIAATINPVSDFLGVGTRDTSYGSTARVLSQPTTEETTSLWEKIRSIINTPNTTSAGDVSTAPLSERTPLLLCIPDMVRKDETALVFWACRDGADTTRATGFNTDGLVVGSTRIDVTEGKTLTLDCVTNRDDDTFTTTSASCVVQVVEPLISLTASAEAVTAGENVRVTWKTNGVQACVLRSDTDPNFVRSGIVGDVVYNVRTDSKLTLTCDDITGLSVSDQILVRVR